MKSQNNTSKMCIFLFFILKMEPKLSECLVLRDFLSDVNKDANEWILFCIVIIVKIVVRLQSVLNFKKS